MSDDLPLKRVGIFGAASPQGIELMRLVSMHPMLELAFAADDLLAGTPVRERFPGLAINVRQSFADLEAKLADDADLVFNAVEGFAAAELARELLKRDGAFRVVDLSPWFRPGERDLFERMSGLRHAAPELAERFTYGYSDRELSDIASARCVSVPSALAQALLVALQPLARDELLTGAVRAVANLGGPDTRPLPGTWDAPSMQALRPLSHPAALEASTWLSRTSAPAFELHLVPVATPASRGVYATVFVELPENLALGSVDALYRRYYDNALFTRHLSDAPELSGVLGSNRAHFSIRVAGRTLCACVALDTLGRGGAMHALELANIMLRLPEEAGLLFGAQSQ